ncbi:MAG: tetratricopeptide repeat protein [Candidatus Aminicenantes bacterium]|nr:MAG: tetratricopeptide repeat protein [Candidatus Aminicenantes bacterium]
MAFETVRKTPLNPYSPWKSEPKSLQRTLVGRDHTVKDILEKTRRFCSGAPPKHCLLVGRRGLGKTHLLSLIYHFYEKKCTHQGYEDISNEVLPVLLLEEERFSLNSLVIFLVKIYQKFNEKFSNEKRWEIPGHLEADDDVIEFCFENLKNISKSENKKIIILCDNLEEVFKQWQEKEYKKLRAFLSDQQTVMIIGTAVKIFKEIISHKEPFYEFFEIVTLVDLSDSQMLELLKKRFIDDNLEEEFNRKEKHLKGKVAAIAKLTGGNPRLVVFLYDIVTKKNVFEVEDATNELMESLSEYFRNLFSNLAPQERTILDAFAEMDGPATPKEISKKTRIKEPSTYAHIKNLKDAGFIEVVEFGKHKISRYDVTERLFRLWRQNATISGRRRFKVLIKLLKLYFTPEELKEDFQRSIKQLDAAFLQNKWKIFEEHLHYLSYLQHAAEGILKFEIFDKMTDFLIKKGDYEKVEDEIKAFKSEIDVDKKSPDLKLVLKKSLKAHLQQERYVDASKDIFQLVEYPIAEEKEEYIEIIDKIIDECPDDEHAWVSKWKILVNAGNFEDALKCFDNAIKLNPREPEYYYAKANALRNLNRFEEALPLIEKAIELDGNNDSYWEEKGLLFYILDKDEEALQAFQKASELNPQKPDYYLRQSRALRYLNRSKEALPLIEKAIELNGNNDSYWEEKGRIFGSLEKYEEALQSFQKASELSPEEPEYYLRQSSALRYLNRTKEALPLIEKSIELDGKNLSYWKEKAKILAELGKHEEGMKCFRESLELNPEDIDHKLEYLRYSIYSVKDLEETGNYLKEIEKTVYDQIRDNPDYLHCKSDYLILTCRFEDAISWAEKRLNKEQDNWGARLTLLINKACLGEFGEHMEGVPGKIIKEKLEEYQIIEVTQFIYRIMEACLSKDDTQRANGLYLTLLKLNKWHKINEVQEVIALYLRQLVDIKNRELFVNAVNSAREHITDQSLLELIKAFLYAGRYLQEGNKVILEEVFPEIREIILDMIEKFEG